MAQLVDAFDLGSKFCMFESYYIDKLKIYLKFYGYNFYQHKNFIYNCNTEKFFENIKCNSQIDSYFSLLE